MDEQRKCECGAAEMYCPGIGWYCVEGLKCPAPSLIAPFKSDQQRITELEAEVAELRKDKARLDWLDSGGVWRMEKRYDTARGAHWPVFFKPTFGWDEHRGDTAREAIDLAMGCKL